MKRLDKKANRNLVDSRIGLLEDRNYRQDRRDRFVDTNTGLFHYLPGKDYRQHSGKAYPRNTALE